MPLLDEMPTLIVVLVSVRLIVIPANLLAVPCWITIPVSALVIVSAPVIVSPDLDTLPLIALATAVPLTGEVPDDEYVDVTFAVVSKVPLLDGKLTVIALVQSVVVGAVSWV